MTIAAKDFEDCLPRYVWHMEEPVCEPPAIALYYITKLAREHVTVLLSGEGGDEAFAGYQNYRNIYWLEKMKRALGPAAGASGLAASALGHVPGFSRLNKYAPLMSQPFEDYYFSRTSGPNESFNQMKAQLYSAGFRASLPVNGHAPKTLARQYAAQMSGMDVLDRMLFLDTKSWLPDDLLVKADKITMANSLELRVPLLDHRVLEFAASLPRSSKLHGLTTKYVLKKALENRVPEKILNRKKTGFPVPYETWIRGEMRDYVRDILTDKRTVERGYFQRDAVEKILQENAERREPLQGNFLPGGPGTVASHVHRRRGDGFRAIGPHPAPCRRRSKPKSHEEIYPIGFPWREGCIPRSHFYFCELRPRVRRSGSGVPANGERRRRRRAALGRRRRNFTALKLTPVPLKTAGDSASALKAVQSGETLGRGGHSRGPGIRFHEATALGRAAQRCQEYSDPDFRNHPRHGLRPIRFLARPAAFRVQRASTQASNAYYTVGPRTDITRQLSGIALPAVDSASCGFAAAPASGAQAVLSADQGGKNMPVFVASRSNPGTCSCLRP